MSRRDSHDDVASRDRLSFADFAEELSRRGLLGVAGKTGVAAATLGGLGTTTAAAQDGDSDGTSGASVPEILNFALTLERLEATYYERAIERWDETTVERSDVARQFAEPSLQYSVWNHFVDVKSHERLHATLLETVLEEKLDADVTAPSEFTFPDGVFDSVESFVGFATVLEDTGVAAYAGVAPDLVKAELEMVDGDVSKLELAPAALGIHSVEARHASYFHTLDERRPWPVDVPTEEAAIDDPMSMSEVVETVEPYLGDGKAPATEFRADLAGDNEVPPVDTDAEGSATLTFGTHGAGPHVHYELFVSDIENVTQAHVHLGGPDENGPVVAFLFGREEDGEFVGPLDDGVDVDERSRLAKGSIEGDDLVGPLADRSLDALLKAMRAENAYVNVHTAEHPAGEVRGQIEPAGSE